jgi:hypothetical protein
MNVQKIESCMKWLSEKQDSQSITYLIDHLCNLSVALAYVNQKMAEAKRDLNVKKVEAYNSVDLNLSPSVLKDYIGAACSEQQYNYDICERASRTIVHVMDAVRTAVSALKEESKYLS